MNEKNPPAFPATRPGYVSQGQTVVPFQEGMTLRDYFAAAALTGLLSRTHYDGELDGISRLSYAYADEMLKSRQEEAVGG